MKNVGIKSIAAAVCGIAVLSFSGCSKYAEPFKDAERGEQNNAPADTLTFPDGFSNASTKCDHGNRVYVLYHSDSAYGSIAVVPNAEDC